MPDHTPSSSPRQAPDADATTETASQEPSAEPPASDAPGTALADTVGTGSVIAIGCIAATLFLIVIGIIFIVITQLVG